MPEDRELRSEVVRTMNGDPYFERDVRRLALSLGGLAVLVLLITCTNVSALLMGLAMARRHEIVVRLSLGAARARIVRQLLTESSLIALAALALRLVTTRVPEIPMQLGITWPATAFTLTMALAVGALFGLAPALHATRLAVASALQDSARTITGTRLRLQRALVVMQVALTQPFVVAVVAAVLFVYADLRPASRYEFGDQLVSVQLMRVASEPVDPGGLWRENAVEIARLRAALESTPGITAVIPDPGPIGELGPYEVLPEDRVERAGYTAVSFDGWGVSPGNFSVAGVPLLQGREFEPGDVDASYVASVGAVIPVVIPDDLVRRLWPGVEPIGRRLRPVNESATGSATLVVTGVIPGPDRGRRNAGEWRVYLPRDTTVAPWGLTVRTSSRAQPLLPAIRAMAANDAPSALVAVRTLSMIQEEWWGTFRRAMTGLFTAGALTLLLSAIGLYAVVAFAVGQRRGEIAVRMAVGAPARRVAGQILAGGVRLGALGLAIGLPISLVGVQMWNRIPDDPGIPKVSMIPVALLASLLAVLTALVASFIPARRAATVDPAQVLRTE